MFGRKTAPPTRIVHNADGTAKNLSLVSRKLLGVPTNSTASTVVFTLSDHQLGTHRNMYPNSYLASNRRKCDYSTNPQVAATHPTKYSPNYIYRIHKDSCHLGTALDTWNLSMILPLRNHPSPQYNRQIQRHLPGFGWIFSAQRYHVRMGMRHCRWHNLCRTLRPRLRLSNVTSRRGLGYAFGFAFLSAPYYVYRKSQLRATAVFHNSFLGQFRSHHSQPTKVKILHFVSQCHTRSGLGYC